LQYRQSKLGIWQVGNTKSAKQPGGSAWKRADHLSLAPS